METEHKPMLEEGETHRLDHGDEGVSDAIPTVIYLFKFLWSIGSSMSTEMQFPPVGSRALISLFSLMMTGDCSRER